MYVNESENVVKKVQVFRIEVIQGSEFKLKLYLKVCHIRRKISAIPKLVFILWNKKY